METESSSFSKPGTCLAEPEMAWRQVLGGAVALDFENLFFTLRGYWLSVPRLLHPPL